MSREPLLGLVAATILLLTVGCQQLESNQPTGEETSVVHQGRGVQPVQKPPTASAGLQVVGTSSVAHKGAHGPELTHFFMVENPNEFPLVFTTLQVTLYDSQRERLAYSYWRSSDGSPYIMGPKARVPFAVAFPSVPKWETAQASFMGLFPLRPERVHSALKAPRAELVKSGGQTKALVLIENQGTDAATRVKALVAGYDAKGQIVAWAPGEWHLVLSAGETTTFETKPLKGDVSSISGIKVYLSAYK